VKSKLKFSTFLFLDLDHNLVLQETDSYTRILHAASVCTWGILRGLWQPASVGFPQCLHLETFSAKEIPGVKSQDFCEKILAKKSTANSCHNTNRFQKLES
jgi:hypothetical protein